MGCMTREFMIAALAAIAAAAVVFTLGFSFLGRGGVSIKQRIKRVALEREKMRAEEMARLRGGNQQDNARGSIRRVAGREYVKNVVDRFSLQKMFADENTVDALARAGYRGQGPLNAYVFARFVTPFALLTIALGIAMNYRRLARHRLDLMAEPPEVTDQGQRADDRLEQSEQAKLVHAALQKVPLEQCAVLVLHELDGFAIPEVATTLGLSLNTAYSRLRLGREAFRTAFRRLANQKGWR